MLLAEKWEHDIDPTGYYMSEKLDGVRGFWSGKIMYSRNKKIFHLPKFFTKDWPESQLDGELWIGRDSFQTCVGIVKTKVPNEEDWKKLTYVVYDCPGLKLPFKERIKVLEEEIKKINSPYIRCHPHIVCKNR